MRFTLSQIETFLCIVDGGTFQRAAKQLHVTSPTISQRVRELEGALEVKLFNRETPRITLTPEGFRLLDRARMLVSTAADIAYQFQLNPLEGILRVGVPHIFGRSCMTEMLSQLTLRYPLLKISVLVADSGTMTNLLLSRELDMAIVLEPSADLKLHKTELGQVRITWFCGRNVGVSKYASPKELGRHYLAYSPPPSRLHSTITRWFQEAGVVPAQYSTCNDPSMLIDVAESGFAMCALPLGVISSALDRGRIKRVHVSPDLPLLPVALCYQNESAGPQLEEMEGLIRRLCAKSGLFE